MTRLKFNLTIDIESEAGELTPEDIQITADIMASAIQNRIFGAGLETPDNVIIDNWGFTRC